MRKTLLAAMLAMLLLTTSAMAEVYEGITASAGSVVMKASASGTLSELSVIAGDVVGEGDIVGSVKTTKVFATQEGTVSRIQAQEDDWVEGTVLEVYPMERYEIYCTVDSAYQSAASTLVHSGEQVFIKCTVNGTHRGTGLITEIDGDEFHVLTTGGELYVGETVYLYRDEDFSTKQRVGIGTVVTSETEVFEASGEIVKMYVSEGEYVERGELLFEVSESRDYVLASDSSGIITEVLVKQGDRIEENQPIMTVVPRDQICVEIQADEKDAASIAEGDRTELSFTVDGEETVMTGTVLRIYAIAEDNAYKVQILPEDSTGLRLGMSVTVRTNT